MIAICMTAFYLLQIGKKHHFWLQIDTPFFIANW